MSKSLDELAREVARVQGQPAGKEEGSESGDGLDADRSIDVSRWKVGKVAPGAMSCENPSQHDDFVKLQLRRSSSG